MQFFRKFHYLLLNLYPKTYREEYGEELHTVFNLSLNDAVGWVEVFKVILHELVDLPIAIIHEHLRERRKAPVIRKFGSYFDFSHGSWKEFLTAMFPFFLMGGIWPLINILGRSGVLLVPSPLFNGIGIGLFGLMGLLFLSGLVTGLPRWSLPYLGIPLSLFSVYGVPQLLERWWIAHYQSLYDKSWFLGQVGYQGFLWVGLSAVTLVLVVMIGFVPVFRRFKTDWTLLVFVLYGTAPFALMFTFDDYVNEEPFVLLAFLVLAIGAWQYLHSDDPRRRFLALAGGLTVALFSAAVAKAIIYQYFWDGIRHFTWLTEMMSTIIMWMWIALSILISLGVKLFPRSVDRPGLA
jgi:hypothetical protein